MPIQTRYLFTAAMDVAPDKEALFHEVYDREHVPMLLQVPGVVSVARLRLAPLTMVIGGERKTIVAEGEPTFSAVYELESPDRSVMLDLDTPEAFAAHGVALPQ